MPQKVEEKTAEAKVDTSKTEDIDWRIEYPDEFYEEYIEKFEQTKKKKYFYRFVKRAFDIFVSLLGLIIASPLFLGIAIAIKIDSKGPVIFKQDRVGRGGKVFKCLKFRSMKIDAPHDCPTMDLQNPERHYTKVGKFIRKLSLDELPQLWCVFIGQMSFLGYRPLVVSEECNEMRARLGVFKMRPGISGYAQVHGRDDLYFKNKALLDSIYVKNASLLFDIKLFFKTIWVVLKREGNDAEKVVLESEAKTEPEKEPAEV